MGVPVNQRKSGRLEVCVAARDLCTYTFRITSNEKKFSLQYSTFIRRICSIALSIHLKCWKANEIVANSEDRHRERTNLQLQAMDDCTEMMALIDIAYSLFHMESKRVIYWTDLTRSVRNKIVNWKESDIKRYKASLKDDL